MGIFIVPDVSYETDGALADVVSVELFLSATAEAQVGRTGLLSAHP